jgi:hypothetical protein
MPTVAAGYQEGSRGNLTQIDATADVRGGDPVAQDVHPADIVRPRQIRLASVSIATPGSAIFGDARLGVCVW